jgi:hypothetical protein
MKIVLFLWLAGFCRAKVDTDWAGLNKQIATGQLNLCRPRLMSRVKDVTEHGLVYNILPLPVTASRLGCE